MEPLLTGSPAYPGRAMQKHLSPTHSLPVSDETYLLTCLLHDIGTTDKNISATLMSFEFYGGQLVLDLLVKELHAPIEQAESVAEAVIRHQDLGESGKITSLGLLIQLATIFGESSPHTLCRGERERRAGLTWQQTIWAATRSLCTRRRLRMW